MGVIPSVLIVYSGMLVEGETVGEAVPSLACDLCVFDAPFFVGKVTAFGHGIAIDSLHGVFLLAAAFALRSANIAVLSSSVLFCRAALLRALISSFCSAVKLLRRALSRSRFA
jgi:hypothetical protein